MPDDREPSKDDDLLRDLFDLFVHYDNAGMPTSRIGSAFLSYAAILWAADASFARGLSVRQVWDHWAALTSLALQEALPVVDEAYTSLTKQGASTDKIRTLLLLMRGKGQA